MKYRSPVVLKTHLRCRVVMGSVFPERVELLDPTEEPRPDLLEIVLVWAFLVGRPRDFFWGMLESDWMVFSSVRTPGIDKGVGCVIGMESRRWNPSLSRPSGKIDLHLNCFDN